MLESISLDNGLSVAQTIRNIIEDAYDRHQEERNRTRLDEISDTVRTTVNALAQISSRIEALFPVVRSGEIEIREKLSRMSDSITEKLDGIQEETRPTAVRMLAMINSSVSREKIEGEIVRILQG